MHTCSHLIHTVQFVCVHCSSLTHINTHTHECLFGCTFQSFLLKEDDSNLPPVCPEGGRLELVFFFFLLCRKKEGSNSNTVLPCCPVHALGCRRQTTFVGSPRLLLAGPGARAVDSHFPSVGALFGGESVSLSVVGHSGTVGALDGGREVVGRRAGLRGGSGRLGCGRTVDFVALGVALGRRAGVDAVRVALGG